jgi:hypothetical protein
MPKDEQIKMHSIKVDATENKTDKEKPVRTKLMQLSVSDSKNKTEINQVKKEIKKKITIKDILLSITKSIIGIPNAITSILDSSFRNLAYTIIGTMLSFGAALVLFPQNAGLFSVFFLTIFLAPIAIRETNLNVLLAGRTQRVEDKGVSLTKIRIKEPNKFSLKDLYHENKKLLSTYILFFIGIMIVVIALIAIMPVDFSAELFSQQGWNTALMPTRNIGFSGLNKLNIFIDILKNNLSVMLVCFMVALIFPLGALLMIIWNAMYWAVSFSQYALFYSKVYNVTLLSILFPLLLSVSLHTIIEAICYFFAVMAGTMLSMSIKSEKFESDRFFYLFKYCLILLVFALLFLFLGSFVEVFAFDSLKNFFFGLF